MSLPRLMLVTDRRRTRGRDLVRQVAEASHGGAGIVQVREKDLPDDELRELIRRIRSAVAAETVLVVNGRLRVARTLGIGLHLPSDAPVVEGARLALVGRSVHDEPEAERAAREAASYVIVGPIHATSAKPGHPGAGVELLQRVRRIVGAIPIYAIGGISVSNAPQAIHAGAHGVAVCGAILSASDPRRMAQALTLALQVASGGRS